MHANSFWSCPTLLISHGLWPASLLCPWHSPGKNTGVGAFLSPGDLPRPRDWSSSLMSPALQAGTLPLAPPGKPRLTCRLFSIIKPSSFPGCFLRKCLQCVYSQAHITALRTLTSLCSEAQEALHWPHVQLLQILSTLRHWLRATFAEIGWCRVLVFDSSALAFLTADGAGTLVLTHRTIRKPPDLSTDQLTSLNLLISRWRIHFKTTLFLECMLSFPHPLVSYESWWPKNQWGKLLGESLALWQIKRQEPAHPSHHSST